MLQYIYILVHSLYAQKGHYWLTRITLATLKLLPSNCIDIACLAMLTLISQKDLRGVEKKPINWYRKDGKRILISSGLDRRVFCFSV